MMAQSKSMIEAAVTDPRIRPLQAERAAKSIRSTVISSPLWVGFLALATSGGLSYFGRVPVERSAQLVELILGSVLVAALMLQAYYRERDAGLTPEAGVK